MVGLGGLAITQDDVEDFEGSPGVGGVQWNGRKGVRGRCIILVFRLGAPLPFLGTVHVSRWPSSSGMGTTVFAYSMTRSYFIVLTYGFTLFI